MNPEVLEKILACKTVPSLPAIAMRVVELTQDSNVSIRQLAETIQNDQGLTTKVLRTVNSSLYGLRQRCSSINQAIVMLGLSAVKTLALGFSLVGAVKGCEPIDFDMSDYWRRSLYTGIAGKYIAAKAGGASQEEAFLGGLLQDVGMIALVQALGHEYSAIVREAGPNHRKLTTLEAERLDVTHADVGAMLADRWRLPGTLVLPIKYHERPTAAPNEELTLVRCVGLANIAAEVLMSAEPAEPLRKYYQRAEQWLNIKQVDADEVLRSITAATREVAGLLSVNVGELANVSAVMEKAQQQLRDMPIPGDEPAESVPGAVVEGKDELSGLNTRRRFDQTIVAAFEQSKATQTPLGLAFFNVDHLAKTNEQYGQEAGDAVLIGVASRLRKTLGVPHVLLARYDGGCYAALFTKIEQKEIIRLVEAARVAVNNEPVPLIAGNHNAPSALPVSVSIGVVALPMAGEASIDDVGRLCQATEKAVKAAKDAGRNVVRALAPAVARRAA